jgi:trimeric autotransporter adhesin
LAVSYVNPYFVIQSIEKKPKCLLMKNHPIHPNGLRLCVFFFVLLLLNSTGYSQTYIGESSSPVDNTAQAGPNATIVPVPGMVAGDLVVIYAQYRATNNTPTFTIPTTGGQTWATPLTTYATNVRYMVSWCTFNGTWAANPVVRISGGGTLGLTAVMYVYRPTFPNKIWTLQATPTNSNSSASPNVINGYATTNPNSVTMAFWGIPNNSTWGTLAGAGWAKSATPGQYRNTTGSQQSHTAAYNIQAGMATLSNVSQVPSTVTTVQRTIATWYESNNLCASASTLTSGSSCVPVAGTLRNSTSSVPAVPSTCGTTGGDVWYQFTATSAYPAIHLTGMGSLIDDNPAIQLFSGTCGALTNIGCIAGTNQNYLGLNTRTIPGIGAGLTIGNTYYIRVYSTTASPTGANWQFNICVTDAAIPGVFDFGKSYINVTKGTTGGTINVGDTLEIRATFVARSNSFGSGRSTADSLSFVDTLLNNRGFKLLPGATAALAMRTNEGTAYKIFDQAIDADAGHAYQIPSTLDTAIRINFGLNADATKRGFLRNTSKPSVFGNTCIIMATYRVEVYAPVGSRINWGGGAITYMDTANNQVNTFSFKRDSLVVSDTLSACPDAVSATNVIGVEGNGTFDAPSNPAPLARNRGTSAYVPGYIYNAFASNAGPGDYYYGIANNTSAEYSLNTSRIKPDTDPDGAGPLSQYRLFGVWDITGDHTGAIDPLKGNAPCDTTLPVSASNPCGYMLVVNSSFKTDTAFQYSATGLCPNTYYEVSAWVKNLCSRCSCDSNGVTPSTVGYIPSGPSDSSGVKPNLAFEINGFDYYTTGNIEHQGARAGITPLESDTANRWVKKGFVYKTGPAETSFTLTIRNNAPGGGGNDWALDDISIATCLPRMSYSPTNNPTVCQDNVITIYDTVRSYFNNYTYYKWQISTNGGSTWNDISGADGTASPAWNGSAYEYIVSYTVPISMTTAANDGNLYRVVVGTTATNLANADCQFSDPTNITLDVLTDCGPVLKTDLLSVSGSLNNQTATIQWSTSREESPINYLVERSADGRSFNIVDTVMGYSRPQAESNQYSFIDPVAVTGRAYYRIGLLGNNNSVKYSRVIQLSSSNTAFGWGHVINPFINELQFEILSPDNGIARVELLDANAKVIKYTTRQIYNGTNNLILENTNLLPAGMYILRVNLKGNTLIRKVMKSQQ